MTPESRLLASIIRLLKRLHAEGRQVWWLKLHGGPMQRAGAPDLLIIYDGRPIFCELKSKGRRATKLQQATLDELARVGAVTAVVYDTRDVIELLTAPGV